MPGKRDRERDIRKRETICDTRRSTKARARRDIIREKQSPVTRPHVAGLTDKCWHDHIVQPTFHPLFTSISPTARWDEQTNSLWTDSRRLDYEQPLLLPYTAPVFFSWKHNPRRRDRKASSIPPLSSIYTFFLYEPELGNDGRQHERGAQRTARGHGGIALRRGKDPGPSRGFGPRD